MSKKNFLLFFIVLVCGVILQLPQQVFASETQNPATGYFKEQLSDSGKIFYDAMERLYDSGTMVTGTGSIQFTEDEISQDQLEAYANGNASLATAFQQARDAFIQDYPEIFYVDFTKLSFRMGKMNDIYVAYLNHGANKDYFAPGITSQTDAESKILEAENAKQDILNSIDKNQSATAIVEAVHNALIQRCAYTYPSAANRTVNSVYGALVLGQGNCEGYSRSMKWLLDACNIPTVLVSGMATNSSNISEYHMWNHVLIQNTPDLEDAWFAVDATWDDPIGNDGSTIKKEYLLAGSDNFNANHSAIGVLSSGSKEFSYPQLDPLDYQVKAMQDEDIISDSNNGLVVYTNKTETRDVNESTDFFISYNGQDVETTLAKDNLHIAMRTIYRVADVDFDSSAGTIDGSSAVGPWYDLNEYRLDTDGKTSKLTIAKKCYLQFCVTPKELPKTSVYYTIKLEDYNDTAALTKRIVVSNYSDYKAPPFILTSNPPLTSRILSENPVTYTVQFDERLVSVDGKAPSVTVDCSEPHVEGTVSNISIQDTEHKIGESIKKTSTVTFTFTPDKSYQAYQAIYKIQLDNYVGVNSGKQPNSIPICTTIQTSGFCPVVIANGGIPSAFAIAYPTLVLNKEMDIFDFEASESSSSMDIRLIATIPGKDKSDELIDALEDSGLSGSIKSSSTYDLNLGCSGVLASLKPGAGYHVTVGLPYPEGFNYNDHKDVEFKAYHYKKVTVDGTEKYVPEELVCRIGPRGLEVVVNSFSPFSVVVTDKTEDSVQNHKLINVDLESDGGSITTMIDGNSVGASGLYVQTSSDADKTFHIEADKDYVIDRLIINDQALTLKEGTTTYDGTFSYSTMPSESSLKVSFIAQSTKAAEEKQGLKAIVPDLIPEIVSSLSVSGKITGSDTSTGLEGASVTLTRKDTQESFSVMTNADGTYTFDSVSNGTYSLEVSKENYSSGKIDNMVVSGSSLTGKDLTLNKIPEFVPVTEIRDVPETASIGTEITLGGTVLPLNASNKNIVWEISDAGTANAAITGNKLSVKASGTVIVKATIADGLAKGRDYTQNFTITVKANPVIPDIVLTGLKIDSAPKKITYLAGEKFNSSGMKVTATYSNKSVKTITNYSISSGTSLKLGQKNVTVSYTEKGVTKTAVQTITVNAKNGTVFSSGNYRYKITNGKINGKGSVSLLGFVKNKSASKLNVPKSVKYKGYTFKITSIADKAFLNNKTLTSAVIGNNVTKIGKSSFRGASKLKTVSIGASTKQIGTMAFYKCSKLKTVTISKGLEKIGDHVFCYDKSLKKLQISSTKLKSGAVGKHNLFKLKDTTIKIPNSKLSAYKKLFSKQGQYDVTFTR